MLQDQTYSCRATPLGTAAAAGTPPITKNANKQYVVGSRAAHSDHLLHVHDDGTNDCGTWGPVSAPPAPATSFGGGAYIVGTDIARGAYRNSGGKTYCLVTKNANKQYVVGGAGQHILTIDSTFTTIESNDCGTWSLH